MDAFPPHTVCCTAQGCVPKAKVESCVGTGSKPPAFLTKRKVIGTIENTRLLCLGWRRCAFSYIHRPRCRTPGQYSTAFKDSQQLSFGLYFPFLSPSLPLPPHALSLPRPSTSTGYYPKYSY